MFASAFVLLLIDIITPAGTTQCDLSKVFTLMDEMAMRGIITAVPYKKDLVELDDLRQKVKSRHSNQSSQQAPDSSVGHAVQPTSSFVRQDPSVLFPPLELDVIWSWMATGERELGVLNPETMQSAIDGLDFNVPNDSSDLQMDGIDWMWGSVLADGSNLPSQLARDASSLEGHSYYL